MKKTKEDVERLKQSWKHDPCYDIEHTPEYEEYYWELLAFRLQYEKERDESYREELAKDAMQKLGTENVRLMKYIRTLEIKIEKIEHRLED